MWWWVSAGLAAVALAAAYLAWLRGRVTRLHRRAEAAAAALDSTLVRRAAAAAVLAEHLAATAPQASADLYAAARAALDAMPAEREGAENDLTQVLRRLPEALSGPSTDAPPADAPPADAPPADAPAADAPAWSSVVTASRRVGLARQVHTDVVRDALALRHRIPVRLFRLASRHPEPGYFDVDDPGMDEHVEAAPTQATGA
jgi:hypothetical protein